MLAHVGDLAPHPNRQVAHGKLAFGKRFQHTQSFGIGEGATDRSKALTVGVTRRHLVQHGGTLSLLAQIRKWFEGGHPTAM